MSSFFRSLMDKFWPTPAAAPVSEIPVDNDPDSASDLVALPDSSTTEIAHLAPSLVSSESLPAAEVSIATKAKGFSHFFHDATSESWNVLVRNSRDGGANSVLAANVLKKTSMMLDEANASVQDMQSTAQAVSTLVLELDRISDDIKQMSTQSKVVSLNATMEAARAGQHGKAFGVVAGELGTLSQSIRELTENIQKYLVTINEQDRKNNELSVSQTQTFGKFEKIMNTAKDEERAVNKLDSARSNSWAHKSA